MSKRKSDAEKHLSGTLRKDRMRGLPATAGGLQGAPATPLGGRKPTPPRGANADVKLFYRRHAQSLFDRGLLTTADESSFQMLAESFAIASEAWRVVQREGFFRRDENGVQRRHPAIQVHRDALATYSRLAAQFGLTPKAREAMLNAGKPDAAGALAAQLFGALKEVEDFEQYLSRNPNNRNPGGSQTGGR